jgi:hypothetical protein
MGAAIYDLPEYPPYNITHHLTPLNAHVLLVRLM